MILNKEDLRVILDVISLAAVKAGGIIQKKKIDGFSVMSKEGGYSIASQVLTEADLLSQNSILSDISDLIPQYDLGLLTEESEDDGSRLEKDNFFAIDPLDGTKSFIDKNEGYSVSITLLDRSGEPLVAAVYDPVKQELFCAIRGEGLLLNGEKFIPIIHNSRCKILTDPGFPTDRYPHLEIHQYGGAVMNVIQVLKGEYDGYIKPDKKVTGGGSIWDFAATTLFLKEVGFIVEGFNGDKLQLNRFDTTFMNRDGYLCCSCTAVRDQLFHTLHPSV